MVTRSRVVRGRYYDSVTLMRVARQVNALPGIADSAVLMGTAANHEILRASGFEVPEGAGDADLVMVVRGEDEAVVEGAFQAVDRLLAARREPAGSGALPRSLDAALLAVPDANLALISVAGAFAGGEARKALERGLHVMLFSDHVPLDEEIALKRTAHERGLLVMGPDCGTAILDGAPLAFANAVRRGDIGLVAAAGTGLQEVTSLVHRYGGGVSQAIGTGGRDLRREVGGITFLDGLALLASDPATRVIVLVSKPPDPTVLDAIGAAVGPIDKPVVAVFLGAEREDVERHGMGFAATLEEAAARAVRLSQGVGGELSVETEPPPEVVLDPRRRYVRGLFSGGTLCYEAQLLLRPLLGEVWSNIPVAGARRLEDPARSVGHSMLDLGDDAFTVGRPHPMIDFELRNRRILEEAADPETAVILLDLVLGHGANPSPLDDLLPALQQVRDAVVVCSVTGTDQDPQNRSRVVERLESAFVMVGESNAAACRLAGAIAAARVGAAV